MRRLTLKRMLPTSTMTTLLIAGLTLLVTGVLLLATGQPTVFAQDDAADEMPAPEYLGRRECSDCHRDVSGIHVTTAHHLTMRDVADGENTEDIIADFDSGAEVRTVTFPGSDQARPFTVEDVAYTVGSGRYVQRYLYMVGEDEYLVFPAEWNTLVSAWQPLTLAEDWPAEEYSWGTNCAYCHTTGYDVAQMDWEEIGVQCEACHGPGSTHVDVVENTEDFTPTAEELVAIRASINPGIDPQTCGQCHSRGTSTEGDYPFPAGYLPGEDLSAHFNLAMQEDDSHWWSTGHASQPNMQYNEWLLGHAGSMEGIADLEYADDTCLSCHSGDYLYTQQLIAEVEAGEREGDAPEPLTLETAQYGVICTTCHVPHSETAVEHPSNLPVESYQLCTSCHSNASIPEHIHHPVQEMFEGLPLVENVAPRENAHFVREGGPDCQTCHMPEVPTGIAPENFAPRSSHTMEIVSPGEALNVEALTDTCSVCHSDLATPEALQQFIDDVQTDTQARIDAARAALTDDTPEWVVNALEFVEGDGSLGIHNYAYADELLDAVDAELGLFAEGTAQAGQ